MERSLRSQNQGSLVESLERLRLTTRVSQQEWLDLLGLHWDDYQSFKAGRLELQDRALESLGNRFKFSRELLFENGLDYRAIAVDSEVKNHAMPERYLQAAHGRRRASINSIDFVEQIGGWRLRLDVLHKFEVPESALQDPFAPISVRFMTDLCTYLNRRQFAPSAHFAMGADTYEATKSTIVGQIFSAMKSVREAYEHFFGDLMRLFEANCDYRLTKLDGSTGILEVRSNPSVAADLGVRHIGNRHLCHFKAGMIACIPRYLGQPLADVVETSCVHRGDDVCRFEFKFSEVTPP